MKGNAYAGGWWNWLTPFSLLTGAALVIGYGLLGATWLILKAEGHVQRRAYDIAFYAAPATLVLIAVVSLWTPFLNGVYLQRWFGWPQALLVIPVPLLVLLAAFFLVRGLHDQRETSPFLAALSLFVLCFIGIGISFYPYIVPHAITIWEAAGTGQQPIIPARWGQCAGARHPHLYRLFLLGVSRQGERSGWLSLMAGERPLLPKKLMWFVSIWAASVAALGVVALAIRWAIHAG